MSKLPDISTMDPDAWYDAVVALGDALQEQIEAALSSHTDAQALYDALTAVFAPFVIDASDPTLADQLIVERDGDKIWLGVPHGDYVDITYVPDHKIWWFVGDEVPPNTAPEELHRRVAAYVVGTTAWGDDELARRRVEDAKRQHV
ncbi:hypothetical protein FRC98_17290 [Lujinxingia vulgaris]|uniref:Uncharacterized protein n=1 Tax=Lujinxingia vulgaris TaxID=2600176 RepID=A0A5C6XDP9_9DELT|nr:hypothetical protein [Lujinxingia vulgaris]TXD35220.1 hypothetical protein FRC98_17290 [Lujinxingia vulgaris]